MRQIAICGRKIGLAGWPRRAQGTYVACRRMLLLSGFVLFLTMGSIGQVFAHNAGGTEHDHPPISAFAQLPYHHIAMSPDGRYVAYLKKIEEDFSIFIYDNEAVDKPPARIDIEDLAYGYLYWASNRRLLVPISFKSRANFGRRGGRWRMDAVETRLVAMEPDGTNQTVLLPDYDSEHLSVHRSSVVSELPRDPNHVLIEVPELFGRAVWVYKVNVHTGHGEIHAVGNTSTVFWGVDPNGNVRVRKDVNWGTQYIYWRQKIPEPEFLTENTKASALYEAPDLYDSDDFDQEISEQDFEDLDISKKQGRKVGTYDEEWQLLVRSEVSTDGWLDIEAVSGSPYEVYVHKVGDGDTKGAHRFNLKTGNIVETFFEHPDLDVRNLLVDWETGRPIGVTYLADRSETVFWDDDFRRTQSSIDNALGRDSSNTVFEVSRGRDKMLIWSIGPKRPGTYYLLDRKRRALEPFLNAYADLAEDDLGEVRSIDYKARDGLDIVAYLTFPPNGPKTNLPLIVMPHGGPASRDYKTFDFWAQFLANRGYLVMQPNFRGSTGYGKSFERAGDGEWGLAMQDDITDGVEHVIAQGLADRNRICLVGGSYGGYAALMGALRSPELYKCAVSFAGVTDLSYTVRKERGTIGQRYIKAIVGDRRKDAARLRETSPLSQSRSFKVPVLLVHGTADRVVSYGQSKQLAQRLKKAKKDHKLVTLNGGDHYLSEYDHRYTFLRETERFLKRHLGE